MNCLTLILNQKWFLHSPFQKFETFRKLLHQKTSHLQYIILVTTLFLSACKKHHQSKTALDKFIQKNETFRYHNFDFDYLSVKSKAKFTTDTESQKLIADIRMKQDSIIWISLRNTTGIEGARILITTDSLFMIDRLNSKFYAYNFRQVSKKINFDIDFDIIQSIIVGNVFVNAASADKLKEKSETYILSDKIKEKIKRYDDPLYVNEKKKYEIDNIINKQSGKLEKTIINDKRSKKELLILYSDFIEVNSQLFPSISLTELTYEINEKRAHLNLELLHSKVTIPESPLSFPFKFGTKKDVEEE